MQTKTIGVVIPIYNVEKYLKECLDSVINQTYTNLEIILVNDGSTDENSLNIAKEYTLKDKRITLFDKKNGGQSTARNVGIEYFSGEYKLKNKTQTIKENSLIEFNIEGNNPYEIYTVYKSYKAFNDEKDLTKFTYPIIDYIIFLDSDDYWELNCIEECVPRMDGVEVVWFANKHLYDNVNIPETRQPTLFEYYNFDKECQISSEEWASKTLQMGRKSFWFTVMGMIDFNFLKNIKLKHYDYAILEDNLFGILLFMQVSKIYILPKQMYRNRVRPNSTMNHDKKVTASNIPLFLQTVYYSFDKDPERTKEYFRVASWVLLNNQMKLFLQNSHLSYYRCLLMREFVKYYFSLAKPIFKYKNDPLNVSSICLEVSNYIKVLTMQTKTIGVVIPIYNVEKYLKECLDSVINQTYTNLEIILVNDGSTDENSLNIAKEYTLKDKRITLFDKKNGGQSTARNVGIEYFSGEYKLKNKTQTIKENSLIEFNIEGNNPYEIYTVYKSYKAFNDEKDLTKFTYPIIDYIIFLDSDDYWELNCIEECVPRMDGVEVVWFDYNKIYESGFLDQKNDWTWFLGYNRNSGSKKISSKLWLERYKHIGHFAFVWQGVINFRFLKNIDLKFIDGIFHQDVHFGFLLFAQSSYIYLLSKKLLVYRIRNGATTARNFKNNLKDEIPFYIQELLSYFEIKTAKEYYSIYSWIQIILNVMHSHNIKNNLHSDLYYLFIGNLSEQILKLKFSYKQDPMHLSGFINFIKTFVGLHRILQNNMQKNSVQLNQLQSKLSFQSQHGTAKQRIQNQLSYKLGQTMIVNSKNIFGILFMPVYIISTLLSHKQEQKIYQEKIKKDPSLKLPSLESYPDYKEALKFKNHLSYKLGQALIKANKTWYKGGYVRFLFELRKIYKQKTMKNSLILYKNRDSNKKDTTRSIKGGGIG